MTLEQTQVAYVWAIALAVLLLVKFGIAYGKSSIHAATAEKKDDPTPFVSPKVEPCMKKVEELKPVPYRAFKWGPEYHVTMGIRNIKFESWIEVDDQLAHYHRIRVHRVKTRGPQLVKSLPPSDIVKIDGHVAATELLEELAEYLSMRYPLIYTVERHKEGSGGLYGDGRIRTITIIPVDSTYNLDEEDPMTVAGLLIQDDLALLLEGTDGVYYLRAGAIICPGFWRLEDKIGMSLDDIHYSGNVPQYETKLKTSMTRYIQRMKPDTLIQRNNYHFATFKDPATGTPYEPLDPTEIGWAESMVGKEEFFQAGSGMGAQDDDKPTQPETGSHGGVSPLDFQPTNLTLRQERQSLRRLPKTRAIVFTVRTYIEPVADLAREVGVPGRMASAIRSWPEDVAGYKSRDRFADKILPYLDERHEKQIAEGLIGADSSNKAQTNYPY